MAVTAGMFHQRILRLTLFCSLLTGIFAEMLPSILWNPENPVFSSLGSSPRRVNPFDKLLIRCPNIFEYPVRREDSYSKDELYENLIMVDKKGYESCNATGGFEILSCDDPLAWKHKTLVFKDISASSSDPIFHPGKEYYLINTASGSLNSLQNLNGGACSKGMKMKIYVCMDDSDPKCPNGNKVIPGGWSAWSECNGDYQMRLCNNPTPGNGGVVCVGDNKRQCATKASTTVGCTSASCSTPTIKEPTTAKEQTTAKPGSPSKDNRTGDIASPYNGFRMSKGLFLGICAIMLLFGVLTGVALTTLIHHKGKQKANLSITRRQDTTSSSRPVSSFSTASESARMVSA